MDPTRPISSKPVREPGARSVAGARKVPDATNPTGRSGAAEVAESLGGAQRALEAGHSAAAKVDEASLETLREAFESGAYAVDADALADRILDDAFGDEWVG